MNGFHSTARTLFRLWVAFLALFAGALWLLPHKEVAPPSFLNIALQSLLFLFAVAVTRHEANAKNKYVFANFAVLFALSFVAALSSFVGPGRLLFSGEEYAQHYFVNYYSGAYALLLALAVVYLAIDALFREFRTPAKYAIALGIVGSFFVIHFNGYLTDPRYAYSTQDVRDWKDMITVAEAESTKTGTMPSAEELAGMMEMYVYHKGERVATLHPDARAKRIAEMYPYLHADNIIILTDKPRNYYIIYMSVLTIGFVLLFFGYQYMKDPPQGAYIEKMMFLFLLVASMEILHAWSGIKAIEWISFYAILDAGQYASVGVLVLIALFFALRLRFIMSAKGEFYELELAQRPAGVTRWRDTLDNIVVDSFFNRKRIVGRLFVAPRQGAHDNSPLTR